MSTALTPIEEVCRTLASKEMQAKIEQALPENMPLDRFIRVTLTALQQNPALASKDRLSLYNSCVRCAADGLLPDGREAALVAFGDKVQYMPMIGGIIKRLAEVNISLDPQCVYENDEFEQILGDDAGIRHKAPKLGQPRGALVGAYAIARDATTGRVIAREVMDTEQMEVVRSASRAKDGDLWTKWKTEAYRKTVSRRLSKRLPMLLPAVRNVIEADDELYEPAAPTPAAETAKQPEKPAADAMPSSLQAVVDQTAPSAADVF